MVDRTRNTQGTVVGVFTDRDRAEKAINDLKQAGFNDNQIGFAVRQPDGKVQKATDTVSTGSTGANAGTDIASGVVGGGIIGGIIGAGAALLIPGFGPAIAGGILAATLGGAAIGAVGGGIIGALVGMGVPEDEARYYQNEFEAGRIIVTVQAGNRVQEAENILQRDGAYNAHTRANMGTNTTTTTTTAPATSTYAAGNNATWETEAPRYRNYWQQNYANQGGRWEDYEPGYRYAWESARNPNYRNRNWNEVESQMRRDWETRYPNQPWDRAGTTVRQAWEFGQSDTQQPDYNQTQPAHQ